MNKLMQLSFSIFKQVSAVGLLSIGILACGGGEESADRGLELLQKTLTVEIEGLGSVEGDIECSSQCDSVLEHDASIQITATPSNGYVFQQWNGACSGNGSCEVVMNSDKVVAAVFVEEGSEISEFELAVSKVGSGSVTSSPAGIDCGSDCAHDFSDGESVTLTASPDAGQLFIGWSGACSGTNSCEVSMTQARSVTANFQQDSSVELFTMNVSVTGDGTVTSSPSGINCGSDCSQEFEANTQVSLTATPSSGSQFVGWGGACSGSSSCNVTMSVARTVTAEFQSINASTFELTVDAVGNGSINSSPGGISCGLDCQHDFAEDTSISLTATADEGYQFSGWSGACSGTGSCNVIMDADKSVTAEFIEEIPNNYDLDVTVIGNGRVTSSPSGIDCDGDCTESYESGTRVVLTAIPDAGFELDVWQGDCSGAGSCSVTLNDNAQVTARFKEEGPAPEILIENYTQQADAFQLGEIPNNASGITWNPELQQYLVVRNNSATVYRYDVNFSYIGQFRVSGISADTEGLAFVEDDQMMIVSEDNFGSRVTVTEFTTAVDGDVPNSQRYRVMSRGGSNKGMEGVAVRKPNGSDPARVYACQEGTGGNNMRVVYFDMPADSNSLYDYSSNLTVIEPFDADQAFSGNVTDLAGMVYDSRTDNLIIVSHESRRAIQIDPDTGAILSTLRLNGAPQYEGVTIGPNGELVFVSEANWIHIFELN